MIPVLVLQRRSHVSSTPFSRSVHARVTEALDWLVRDGRLRWDTADEHAAVPADLDGYRALILNKHYSPESLRLAEAARARGMTVIYDLDDWMLGFPDYSGAGVDEQRKAVFSALVRTATHVTVANQQLVEYMRPFRGDIVFLPNGFDVEKYGPCNPASADANRVVFSNADQLKLRRFKADFLDLLVRFFARHPNLELDFYGDPFDEMGRLPFLRYQGSLGYSEHKRRLAAGGYAFAIVPLSGQEDPEDLPFNSCKNPFKYLEYGGLAIPAVFSRSPIFEGIVRPGETGLLVDNTIEAWEQALERLATDPGYRRQVALDAHRHIAAEHSIRFSAEGIWQILSAR